MNVVKNVQLKEITAVNKYGVPSTYSTKYYTGFYTKDKRKITSSLPGYPQINDEDLQVINSDTYLLTLKNYLGDDIDSNKYRITMLGYDFQTIYSNVDTQYKTIQLLIKRMDSVTSTAEWGAEL